MTTPSGGPTRIDDGDDATLLVWGADGIEQNTIEQAQRMAGLPFIHGHIALMPDAHLGYGSTVGSVIATDGAIIPAAIGVDIGCGMVAARLDMKAADLPDKLGPVHGAVRSAIPAGVGQGHSGNQELPERLEKMLPSMVANDESLLRRALTQFGTLGSGNHFVEICLDQNDDVWAVLHSGSRGVGKEIAERHIAEAKGLMGERLADLPDPDLAHLTEGTPEFKSYIADMLWAQEYAAESRRRMMENLLPALMITFDRENLRFSNFTNCHHNYTDFETKPGSPGYWVTRKGAIRARIGDMGIIPGSMGTATFIVKGLGNEASYNSASHGAGRRMSRGQARKTLSTESLREKMEGKTWNDRDADLLVDEHPDAYKDVHEVMAAQADLVAVVWELHQVLNYKGAEEGRRGKRKQRVSVDGG